MIAFKLASGEVLVFNNQRLTHGRMAAGLDAGKRQARNCSVDLTSGTRGCSFSAPGKTIHVSG